MNEVRMTTTHPCYLRGLHVDPGTEVSLAPTEAQVLLDSGRGQLLDPLDEEPLRTALAEAFAETLQRTAQAQPEGFGLSPESAASVTAVALERAVRPRGIGFILPASDN